MVDAEKNYMALNKAEEWLANHHVNIKAVTLRKYCSSGKMGFKLGHIWIVSVEDLEKILLLPEKTRQAGRRKILQAEGMK